jgi:hypothetical protein
MSLARRRRRASLESNALPGQIEYRGARGTTRTCLESLASYLQESREKGVAVLLSSPQDKYKCRSHALLLVVDGSPRVLISDGFSSGYMGEGPHGLVSAISILDTSGWGINEILLGEVLFERLCAGLATWNDLGRILKRRKKPVSHVFDYMPRESLDHGEMCRQWQMVGVNIPLPLIDPRLLDIATQFWADPDGLLGKAYRRLEDLVRKRCGFNGANDHGARLFSKAFGHDKSPLVWRVNDEDSICYAPLFAASFSGFRNLRSHRDPGIESEHALARELLQLNQLFILEAQLAPRASAPDPKGADEGTIPTAT